MRHIAVLVGSGALQLDVDLRSTDRADTPFGAASMAPPIIAV